MSHKKILHYLMSNYLKRTALLAVALLVTAVSYAQDSLKNERVRITSTNISDKIIAENITDNFVRIDTSISNKALKNIIISNLFSQNVAVDNIKPIDKYSEYVGKIIDSIFIVKARPFDPATAQGRFMKFLYRTGNTFHHISNSSIIEKGLLFEPGERVKSQNIDNSIALLNQSGIFTSVEIYIEPSPTNSEMVNIYVVTQDNLSLRFGGTYRYSADADLFISDRNFMGTGNTLTARYFLNIRDKKWAKRGELGYDMRNLGGKYINASAAIGAGYDTYVLRLNTDKYFIKDGDYAFGAGYTAIRSDDSYFTYPTKIFTQNQNGKVWGGKSFVLGNYNNNIYFNAGAYYVKYNLRPEVSETFNPWFHNNLDFITSFGFYREKYYTGNLIYGYGHTETIPYGYKLEATGGYRKGEFQDLPYVGFAFKMGNLVKIGYLSGDFNFGTFLVPHEKRTQEMIFNTSVNYFTNLLHIAPGYFLRQFIKVGYTTGVNMLEGERTTVKLNNNYGLLAVSSDRQGNTRLEANAESVLFTPLHVYGFRFAFFGFIDCGTIGSESYNPFKNEFYGIMGVGVRMRNETLVFSTLQIRIGVAIRSSSTWRNSLYNLSANRTLPSESFKPQQPSFIPFD